MTWDGRERRQHARVAIGGRVRGKIHTIASAPIINISASGALLETPCSLPPDATYVVRLGLGLNDTLELKARVRRSYVHGFDKNTKGETVIRYRVALQFTMLSSEHKDALSNFMNRMEKLSPLTAQLEGQEAS